MTPRSAILNVMTKAVDKAARALKRDFGEVEQLQVSQKGPSDFVSNADLKSERILREELSKARPAFGFLAEESGAQAGSDAEHRWLIDPLDGTTNFLHGLPQYAVSIALAHKGTMTQAVVYDPCRNDLFTASRGRGAYLNNRRLRVSKRIKLEDALIGTGFPFRELKHLEQYLAMFRDLVKQTAGVRRPGSASLDLAYVAAGWYDGFWELGLSRWDIAAGTLLITEAGGLVGDLQGGDRHLETGHIVAANPKIFAQLLRVIAPHLSGDLKV